jgi:glycosidase
MFRSFAFALLSCSVAFAAQAPKITKIDPPNWWANMPKPMLLVNGENLNGAQFRLSDSKLRIAETKISSNGRWAELWLSASPNAAESITITATTSQGKIAAPFVFEKRHPQDAGFQGFSSKDVMYLIMTDRFADGDTANDGPTAQSEASSEAAIAERKKIRGWHGGDLRGITQHLDYLQALGITTVWITPVYANNNEPDSYHGYGATDMYAVDPHYGSLQDFRTLAEALHKRGMKLVLDTVPNHTGPAHPWVNDMPEPNWFHGTKEHHTIAQGDFLPLTDPHAPVRDTHNVTEGWFADVLPDLNQANPAVSQYLIQNALWWIEQGTLDGLRIDTFPYVDRSFWPSFHQSIHAQYPHVTDVGEIFNPDPTVTSAFAGGVTRIGVDTGLYTPFDFPLHVAIVNAFTGKAPMTALTDALRGDSLYPHPERLVPFLDNHDMKRFLSESGTTSERQRLALAFLLTTRGTPQLYTGDELGIAGGDDPDNRRDSPWFLDASQASTPVVRSNATWKWTAELLKLRSELPALQHGSMEILYSSADTISFLRYTATEHILVSIHVGNNNIDYQIPTGETHASQMKKVKVLLGDSSVNVSQEALTVRLATNSISVVALN